MYMSMYKSLKFVYLKDIQVHNFDHNPSFKSHLQLGSGCFNMSAGSAMEVGEGIILIITTVKHAILLVNSRAG